MLTAKIKLRESSRKLRAKARMAVKKKTKKGGNSRNTDGDDDDNVNYNILFHFYQNSLLWIEKCHFLQMVLTTIVNKFFPLHYSLI